MSVESVHSLCPMQNVPHGGRPRMMNKAREQISMLELVKGRMDTITNATKHMHSVLRMEVNC